MFLLREGRADDSKDETDDEGEGVKKKMERETSQGISS